MRKGLQKGFTLVEVVLASGVLAFMSAGLLAATWGMVGFARDEAERMMADNLAHDIMRAVYSQNFDDISSISTTTMKPELALPWIVTKDILGKSQTPVCSLWRDQLSSHKPTFKVSVSTTSATETVPESKTISVTVYWYVGSEKRSHSPTKQIRYRFEDGS